MNHGEINEILFKAYLIKCFDKGINLESLFDEINIITSLSFGPGVALPEWEDEYEPYLQARDWSFLKEIFPKAPSDFKADLSINNISFSVKYNNAGDAALVNHTNRDGFLRISERLGVNINALDAVIEEYWVLRLGDVIKQDIKNDSPDSPFKTKKEVLRPYLEYFLFEGTGRGASPFPADRLLELGDPYDASTIEIHTKKETVDAVWDDLVFSIRSKGMPKKYSEATHSNLAKWTRFRNNRHKGSLHIRL